MLDSSNEFVQIDLNTEKVLIKFSQLCKYSTIAQGRSTDYDGPSFISRLIENFQCEHHINDSSYKTFAKIINEEKVDIHKNEFNDLYVLSHFLKVNIIINALKEFISKSSANIDLIIDLLNNHQKTLNDEKIGDDDISSFIENCLTANIKKCFKNVKFNKLPISSLYRIVEKNGQKNSDDLVDFIKKSIQERYILFNFLNTESLSDKKFDELYNDYINSKEKTTIHYYDSIHKDLIYIKKLNEMKIKQKNLQDEIKSLKKENQDLIEKNKYLKIKSKLIKKTYSDEKERDQNNDFNIITKAIMPNYSNWIFLAIACGKGNLKLAQYIVSSGRYSLLENHSMYLQSACSSGNLELVKYIISYNQSNITSRTILNRLFFY